MKFGSVLYWHSVSVGMRCREDVPNCAEFAARGECARNPHFMIMHCAPACCKLLYRCESERELRLTPPRSFPSQLRLRTDKSAARQRSAAKRSHAFTTSI
jgi:hypothetical protein